MISIHQRGRERNQTTVRTQARSQSQSLDKVRSCVDEINAVLVLRRKSGLEEVVFYKLKGGRHPTNRIAIDAPTPHCAETFEKRKWHYATGTNSSNSSEHELHTLANFEGQVGRCFQEGHPTSIESQTTTGKGWNATADTLTS